VKNSPNLVTLNLATLLSRLLLLRGRSFVGQEGKGKICQVSNDSDNRKTLDRRYGK
jgi:hypothetical protein